MTTGEPFTTELTVEAELHGVRIDSFLIKHFRNYTSWRMQRVVAAGGVTVNDALASPTQRVFVGEMVRVRLNEPPDKLLAAEPVAFRRVYQDHWLMVIDKPAGVLAHPTGEFQAATLANGVQAYLDSHSPVRGLVRPGLVHRLDRQTSGLMVIATHHKAHAELSVAFENGRVSKSYLAIVEGRVQSEQGVISSPIGRARGDRRVLMSARPDAVSSKPARTQYRVEERFAAHTLVVANPKTGRNHQIRVHLAHIGHPLVGDEYYAAHGVIKPWKTDIDASNPEESVEAFLSGESSSCGLAPGRHALHAAALSFAHPISGAWLTFRSELPYDLRQVVSRLRGSH